jgi:glycosyltransferase involved in cell wall biosynthesis
MIADSPATQQSPRISVVIPVHNGAATLSECLAALRSSTFDNFEVVVADDASTDGSAKIAEQWRCRTVRLTTRSNAAGARNAGANQARGSIILFTDADVVLPPDALQRVWDDFQRHPEIVAVQGIYRSPGRDPTAASRYQNDYYHYFCRRIKGLYTSVFATWCAAVKPAAFWEAGGFDQRIAGATVEDEELGYELAERGHRILLDRGLLVEHLARYTTWELLARRFRMARSQMKSALRKAPARLFRRYANLGRNLTHHSRKTLLLIPVSYAAPVLLFQVVMSPSVGAFLWLGGAVAAFALLAGEFLLHAAHTHGFGAVFSTIVLLWLDMLSVGLGLVVGATEYLLGRRF